jgi:hypothetical protein
MRAIHWSSMLVSTMMARLAAGLLLLATALAMPTSVIYGQGGGGFVFPYSDRELLDGRDLLGLSCRELDIARNEIYARRGRYFERPDLRYYFEHYDWYHPFTWNPQLDRIERANIALIARAERGC